MSGTRPKFSAFVTKDEHAVSIQPLQTVFFGFADVSPEVDVVMKPSKSVKKETKSRSPVKASKAVAKKGVSPVKKSAKKPATSRSKSSPIKTEREVKKWLDRTSRSKTVDKSKKSQKPAAAKI